MKVNKAIFPGSFDPITFGHIDIIKSGLTLFEKIIIAVGSNEQKKNMFTLSQRKKFIKAIFRKDKRIIVKDYKNLTVEFCEEEGVNHIIRGVRNNIDFEYEKKIALTNHQLNPNIETVFFSGKKEHDFISSTIVREIVNCKSGRKSDLQSFIPQEIIAKIIS